MAHPSEKTAIAETVTRLFHAINARDWETVHALFTDQVERVIENKHVEQVAAWPGITTDEGQFNSTTFQIGSKEIGHVHVFRPVDISYQQPLRDQLIADGRTGKNHIFPKSNYTTFSIDSQDDIDTAVWLLRVSYLYHVVHIQRRGTANEKLLDIDVNRELAAAAVSDDVRAIFEEHFEWFADNDGTNVNQKLYTGGVS